MTIRIAKGLELADDIATQSIAILARRGAGKTYTASVLVEEVVKAKVPVVVLDPTGAWWGLRTSADGERPGLPVVIFGGDHADVPLESTAGKVIADVVIEHPGAYVVDLSAFESKGQEIRFAADFLERLYRAKKRETGPLLVVVDEADLFAPQRPGPEQTRTLGALEAIVRRGRIKGLGDLVITQRAAVLNKNVLTQTEVLVVMQTTGPQDRAAIDEWIAGNGTKDERAEVLDSLASLERGEAWVWSPQFLRALRRVRIRTRTTFDSSRTPESGEVPVAPRAFAKVDLEQLGERIRSTIEQQKANDPAELRRRIVALERQLGERPAENVVETVVERVEVPVVTDAQLHALEQAWVSVSASKADLEDIVESLVETIKVARETAPRSAPEQRVPAPTRSEAPLDPGVAQRQSARSPMGSREVAGSNPVSGANGGASLAGEGRPLKAGARRMLSALAWLHPRPLTKEQLAMLSGVQRGGTFSDYLRSLTTGDLALEDGRTIVLTAAGTAAVASELGHGAPSTAELVAIYAPKLKAGARRMLDLLIDRYPDALSRNDLSELADIQRGGTFSDYLRSLTKVGLADDRGGTIRAGDDLFLADQR